MGVDIPHPWAYSDRELAAVARHKAAPGIVGSEAEGLDWMQVSANQPYAGLYPRPPASFNQKDHTMQITIDLPDYVVDVLTREAAYKGITPEAQIVNETKRHADSMMSVWRGCIEDRMCHKCGEFNSALHEFDSAHKGPWKTCVNCGNKLTIRDRKQSRKMQDGTILKGEALAAWYRDLDMFLRRARKMRAALGMTPERHHYASSEGPRKTFAESMSEFGFSEAAIDRLKSLSA